MSDRGSASNDRRKSDFSYGKIFERSSSLNDIGNPVVVNGDREGESSLEGYRLARDRKTIESCVNLLDDSQERGHYTLSWLCSHKQRVFIMIVHALLSLIIWQHFFVEKYRSNVDTYVVVFVINIM